MASGACTIRGLLRRVEAATKGLLYAQNAGLGLPGPETSGPVTVITGVGTILPLVAKLSTAEPVEFKP
jgi:hypothetical protein